MNSQILVHFDRGAFLIKCPYHANDLIRALPAVRWSKANQCWRAPLTRQNVAQLLDVIRPAAQFTQVAQDAIHEYESKSAERNKKNGSFPSWYAHKLPPMGHQKLFLESYYPKEEIALFADMGTGKSKMAIDFNAALRIEGKIDAWLIICKLSLRKNWVDELKAHCPIPYSVHLPDTDQKVRFDKWLLSEHDFKICIIGIESLSAGRMIGLAESFVRSFAHPALTLDESSMISGHKALRSSRVVELGRSSSYRQALTGTPMAEGPMNLYMQFEFLNPDIIGIGDFYAFRNRYAVMGGYRDPKSGKPLEIVGYQNLDELVRTIKPWTYQVSKDVLGLPPKRYQTRTVVLTDEQRKLYNNIKKESGYTVDDREVALANCLETMLRLHQISGGWIGERYEVKENGKVKRQTRLHAIVERERNPKLIEFGDVAEEIRGRQCIVWSAYRHELDDLGWFLSKKGISWLPFHGGCSEAELDNNKKAFQAGKAQFLLGTASTGGMGHTLTAAKVVIYYSNTQKLIDRLQSEDRAHRKGQNDGVLYIDIVAEKTVDVTFIKALKNKKDVTDYVRERLDQIELLLEGGNGE